MFRCYCFRWKSKFSCAKYSKYVMGHGEQQYHQRIRNGQISSQLSKVVKSRYQVIFYGDLLNSLLMRKYCRKYCSREANRVFLNSCPKLTIF